MIYNLSEINDRVKSGPKEFARECEAEFNGKVNEVSDRISAHMKESPIVLLSGPSGSGKTTTAKKICEDLYRRGIKANPVSLDNYFMTVDETLPKTKSGEYDRESPLCLDIELIGRHIKMLECGEEILIPYFDFKTQSRVKDKVEPLCLGRDEAVIFEGIHALNDMIAGERSKAFKLYISARSNVVSGGEIHFKGTWMRLVRRVVRDELFRGADAVTTLKMWANVRRGEKKHISPFRYRADVLFNSAMAYEIPVMKKFAEHAFSEIEGGTERFIELRQVLPALACFADIGSELVPPDSILREFIGGGIFEY